MISKEEIQQFLDLYGIQSATDLRWIKLLAFNREQAKANPGEALKVAWECLLFFKEKDGSIYPFLSQETRILLHYEMLACILNNVKEMQYSEELLRVLFERNSRLLPLPTFLPTTDDPLPQNSMMIYSAIFSPLPHLWQNKKTHALDSAPSDGKKQTFN